MDFKTALLYFADIDETDYALAEKFIIKKTFKKGDLINVNDENDKFLAYIEKGLIRSYYIERETGKEKTLFFFQERHFLSTILDFNENGKSNYYREMLEDCELTTILQKDLLHLYKTTHKWEHFGRILAEAYYKGTNERKESFIFQTAEERYLQLIKTFPTIFQRTSLIHISTYLGVESQSLSRIRNRLSKRKK